MVKKSIHENLETCQWLELSGVDILVGVPVVPFLVQEGAPIRMSLAHVPANRGGMFAPPVKTSMSTPPKTAAGTPICRVTMGYGQAGCKVYS